MRLMSLVFGLTLSACNGAPPAPPAETAKPKVEEPAKVTPPPALATAGGKADCSDARPQRIDPETIKPLTLPADAHPGLTDASKANEKAPDVFKVRFTTTKGDFVIEAHRDWAPVGVDRFYNLVKIGYFDQVRFFRAIDGFMVQFGVNGYPQVNKVWSENRIADEPVKKGNQRGFVTFAKCGMPDCRSTQIFVNYKDNSFLDGDGFAAFGEVVVGMDVVDSLYKCYGEGAPRGMGPRQDLVQQLGNAYLDAGWPNLDGVISARVE
jgi:peptidyl-prolyl cis-trans isomerase A (cyclophilin A)